MSNYNRLFLSAGDLVLVHGMDRGKVIDIMIDDALIEITLPIDGQIKTVKQWYKNDALIKIEQDEATVKSIPINPMIPPEITLKKIDEAISEIIKESVKEKEKHIEFGVPPEVKIKKKTKSKITTKENNV